MKPMNAEVEIEVKMRLGNMQYQEYIYWDFQARRIFV